MRLIYDLETNGFLDTQDFKIHCIAVMNADDSSQTWVYGPSEIDKGVQHLQTASELIAHNGITFDNCAIRKLYPSFNFDKIKVTDTLVLSRLIHPNLKNDDFDQKWVVANFPKRMYGSHSLKAWGHRLGVLKGGFSNETTDWSVWTPEMQEYCQQDVVVTKALLDELSSVEFSERAIRFEHQIAELCDRIGKTGWVFDNDKAAALYGKLSAERQQIGLQLHSLFPSWTVEEEFIPKVNNKSRGYVKGVPFIKTKEIEFNPNSRAHIEYCLRQKYDWQPTEFTPSGAAKIDESTLSELPYPEAKSLARSFMLQKRIGMLAEGNAAWMKLVDNDGKLRHTINPLGTISGRCSSFAPNLQQVPAVRAEFGKECRELFTVPKGYELVGVDLSGIELRILAHFLEDGGAYAREVVEGDIHTANMKAFGLTDRSQAKTAIYCMVYGGGDAKLGQSVGKSAAAGRDMKAAFVEANPAFARLVRKLKQVVDQRGYLYGLDGRKLIVRGHAHLNLLIQSAAALIAKKWVQLVDEDLKKQALDAHIVAFVHDEIQIAVKTSTNNKGEADYVGHRAVEMAREAGKFFSIKTPIDAEYGTGFNWSDTH